MGGIKSRALRPFKGYNFEHRAQRLVKKEQESAAPKAAPKHASSQELLEKHAAGETFRFLKIISIFRSDPKGPVLGPIAQSVVSPIFNLCRCRLNCRSSKVRWSKPPSVKTEKVVIMNPSIVVSVVD